MNYKEALKILEINLDDVKITSLTLDVLKRQYHTLALKNHPDKNGNTSESNEKFKKINEAYNCLKSYITIRDNVIDDELNEQNQNEDYSTYMNVLHNFMKNMFDGLYSDAIKTVVKTIISKGQSLTLSLFDDLDKDTSLGIYTFLSRYKSVLHLSGEMLEQVRAIVLHKFNEVQVYKLNPSVNDILNNNIYKLYVNDKLYLVPLWHNESYFDGSGCEIIVLCEPELPDNIKIDDDNNIMYDIKLSLTNDLSLGFGEGKERNIAINIGEKVFEIPPSKIYIKKEQYYRLQGQGITKIKRDIYDVTDRADIIIKITITA
jgi:hypothetical protein